MLYCIESYKMSSSDDLWKGIIREGEEVLYNCPCEGILSKCNSSGEKNEKRGRFCVTSQRMILCVSEDKSIVEISSSQTSVMLFVEWIGRQKEHPMQYDKAFPEWLKVVISLLIVAVILEFANNSQSFIYFQF